jgi:pyrroline-5-carboxylate reductase
MTKTDFPGALPNAILVFGCGNMAGAMLRGWIARGADPACFHVVKPTPNGLPDGVHYYSSAAQVTTRFDVMLLGIKPQMLGALAHDAASLLTKDAQMLSLLAGTTCAALQSHFPYARAIRLMPNLAVEIGKSPLGLWANGIGTEDQAQLNRWLSHLGAPIWLGAEEQMDALTALAGSGPAFIFRMIDALANAGEQLGLEPAVSAALALNMTEGAAMLAARANESPAVLANRVASPGGMTRAGLDVLDNDDALAYLMKKTLAATAQRGAELAKITQGEKL